MRFDRSRGWTIAAALVAGQALASAVSSTDGVEVAQLPVFLNEVSGLAQSRTNPGVFWVHNDSGDEPRIYAVGRSGAWLGSYTLAGATAVDWEDMAIGPAADGRSYLYLADIGDNAGRRPSVRVYRVKEPVVDADQSPVVETLSSVTAYDFVYEDGPRDAEGFMLDPLTNHFYVVSKREPDGNHLYRSVSPSDSRMNTLDRVGRFSVTGTTGADISPDGLQVLIR
ncbi:MAG: PE family protein, partial [Acidobacteria bacterium]